MWNFELKAVYLVAILDFTFDEETEERFCHTVQLKNDDNKVFYDKLTYIFLEMPKFKRSESELKTSFDKWCYVLKHLSEFRRRPRAFQEKVFKKLFKEAEIVSFTEEERMRYEQSLKRSRDYKNTIETAFAEGEKKVKSKAERKLRSVL
jgi:predicted transposase/invertase (TIGR01784 family)